MKWETKRWSSFVSFASTPPLFYIPIPPLGTPSPLHPDPMDGVEVGVMAMRRPRKRSWTGGGGAVNGRGERALLDGFSFSSDSQPRVFWNSRRRSQARGQSLPKTMETESLKPSAVVNTTTSTDSNNQNSPGSINDSPMLDLASLSERRKALFEPLDPSATVRRHSAEELLPPPDFDELLSYPRGWLVGKKRKLVNVDVVESMRRIAVREMNRKDREIDGLNEQLEEDAKCVERLQEQLLEERRKRAAAEREKAVLESQVAMLMEMLNEAGEDGVGEEGEDHQEH